MKLAHLLALLLMAAASNGFEFYDDPDYEGLIPFSNFWGSWDARTYGCYNFPFHTRRTLSSVKFSTGASCIILYDDVDCEGKSIKLSGEEDVPSIAGLVGKNTHDNFDNSAVSFRFCDEDEGSPDSVDVELFNSENYGNATMKYDQVCKCVSISASTATFKSVDNHHNCIRLYTSDKCEEGSEEEPDLILFAGKSSISGDLSSQPIYGKVRSLKACDVPLNCFRLKSEVYLAEIIDDPVRSLQAPSDFLSMSARTVFWNNGAATVTQEYSASKRVREVIEVNTVAFSRRFTSWKATETTEYGVSLTASIGVKLPSSPASLSAGIGLKHAIEAAYSDVCEWAEETSESFIQESFTEFSVRQEIEVGPCTQYDVDSLVRVQSNYPLTYKLFFRLRGEFAGRQMTAEELIVELNGMRNQYTYNHTIDDYTVAAFGNSTITASFGVDTEIVGEGTRIQDCS